MSNFSFTSTAECDYCGAYLSSSDEDCDHDGLSVETHVFRRLNDGRESMTGVRCTIDYKWHKLEEKVGDDWIAYQWLGTKESVESMLEIYDGVSDLPQRAMSLHAPNDVGDSDNE